MAGLLERIKGLKQQPAEYDPNWGHPIPRPKNWLLEPSLHSYATVADIADGVPIGPLRRSSMVPPIFVPTGWSCVTKLVKEMATQPFAAKVNKDGVYQPAEEGSKWAKIAALLDTAPSTVLDRQQFWTAFWRRVFETGNAHALIHRNSRLMPVQLELVTRINPPTRPWTEPIREVTYEFREYRTRKFPPRDVLAIHGDGYDARLDRSPSLFHIAAKALGVLDEGIEDIASAMNDPRIIYSIDAQLMMAATPAQRVEFLAATKKGVQDAEKKGQPLVMAGADVSRRSLAQLGSRSAHIEDFKWASILVCQSFGVPPRLVGIIDSGMRSEASLQGQMEDLYQSTIEPHAKAMTAQLTAKLAGGSADMGYKIMLDAGSELKGTMLEKAETLARLGPQGGFITPNWGRSKLGIEKSDDEKADKLFEVQGGPGQADGRVGDRKSPQRRGDEE